MKIKEYKELCLPLKKEWYEMIESLIKGEEYRGITAYWIPRLLEYANGSKIPRITANVLVGHPEILGLRLGQGVIVFKKYTHVKFSYGYTKRTMTFEIESITIGKGKAEWGAPDEDVFIIHLGKRLKNWRKTMIQVEWNKEHTWKITKKYVNGKLDSFKYQGLWYVPVKDYSGIETDACGNTYIGSDCCDNCPLEKDCFAFNPINEACKEFNKLCMRMEYKS